MDGDGTESRSRRRPSPSAVEAALVLVLLVAVAVAASGAGRERASGGTRPISHWAIDIVASFTLVLLVFGAVAWVWVLGARRSAGLMRDKRAPVAMRLSRLLAAVVVLSLAAALWIKIRPGRDAAAGGALGGGLETPPGAAFAREPYQPGFATVPVVVVLALLAAGALAFLAARRATRRTLAPAVPLGLILTEVLDDTLDDIRAESDPRRAIVAAYARMEHVLAANGVARHEAEAPEEYLARVLRDLEVSADGAARLTRLFAVARFSRRDVDAGMKDEAIAALEALREELRAATATATPPAPTGRPAPLGPAR